MLGLFKKKVKLSEISNPPTVGALFEWSEPTCYSLGTVRSIDSDNKFTINIFAEDAEDNCRIVSFERIDGVDYIHRSDGSTDKLWENYVDSYFTFHNTADEKKKLLQRLIDNKINKVLPKYEDKLQFQKNELKQFQEMQATL